MKRNLKTMAIVVFVIILSVWIIDKIPFKAKIDMQVEPTIYMAGKFVDKTTVTIKGEKTRYLFGDDSFVGEIRIACVEKTAADGLQAKISWHGNDELQSLAFYYKEGFLWGRKLRTHYFSDYERRYAELRIYDHGRQGNFHCTCILRSSGTGDRKINVLSV